MADPDLCFDPGLVIAGLCVAFLLMLCWLQLGMDSLEASQEQSAGRLNQAPARSLIPHVDNPEQVSEVIGRYMDAPIYRSVTIGGMDFQFDHIQSLQHFVTLAANERYLEPGVVYIAR